MLSINVNHNLDIFATHVPIEDVENLISKTEYATMQKKQ